MLNEVFSSVEALAAPASPAGTAAATATGAAAETPKVYSIAFTNSEASIKESSCNCLIISSTMYIKHKLILLKNKK